MAYAVLQDAIDLYPGTELPDEDSLLKAFEKFSSEMDSYLGVHYVVPVTPVPDVLIRYCVDGGIYLASADAGMHTEEKRLRYEDAIKWLRSVSKGEAILVGAGATASNVELPEISGPTRIFSRSTMSGL